MKNNARRKASSACQRINCLIIPLLCFLLFSCAKKQTVKPMEKPLKEAVTAKTLRNSFVFKDIKTLKSEITVKISKGEEITGRFDGIFAYMAPDSMNMRIFGPMGLTIMEVAITKRLFQVYIPHRNILFEEEISIPSFNTLLDGDFIYSIEEAEDKYILYVFEPDGNVIKLISKYGFEKTTLLNTSISLYREGKKFMGITFDGFSDRISKAIKIFFNPGFGMEIALKNPYLNAEIPEDYFKPIPHNNKEVRSIQDLFLRLAPSQ